MITFSTNEIVRITNAYSVIEHWPFFLEGMTQLNDPRRARANYTPDKFFNMLSKVAELGDRGLLCLLTSKKGKPLGFGCAFAAMDFMGDECFYVWAAYSNSKCATALTELLDACENYAKFHGHTTLKTATPRITGAAYRLFEARLGFSREFITFRKDLTK